MKNINTTETTAVVCFNFGSCARVGVTLYEGLTVDECVAIRSEDIEEYRIEGGEWTTRKATADEARQHLEALRNEEETESTEGGEETAPAFTIAHNDQFNSLEISFNGKPSAEVRDALKALRFRWHGQKKVWYGYATQDAVIDAIAGADTTTAQDTATGAGKAQERAKAVRKSINLDGIENNRKTCSGAELAAVIRADLKARGATGVTIRAGKATHTDTITATVTMSAEDFRSVEEVAARGGWEQFFRAQNYGVDVGGVWYHNAGKNSISSGSRWDDASENSNADILRQFWRDRLPRFSVNHYHMERKNCPEITDTAFERLDSIYKIINSYNWDHSDSMTDYYDVGFYFDMNIKMPQGFQPRETMTEEERAQVYADEKAEAEAWVAECARMEEERKQREEEHRAYMAQLERDTAEILAEVEVIDLDENGQYFIRGLDGGIGKECSLDEVRETAAERSGSHDALITRRVEFKTSETFAKFSKLLLNDWDFVAGKGGTATNDSRVTSENINHLSAEQRAAVSWFSSDCVAVYLGGVLQCVINPEGYNYCRYTYIPTERTIEEAPEVSAAAIKAEEETERDAFYIPAPVVDQAAHIVEGDTVTVYQADDWLLSSLKTVSGTVEAVRIGDYAQYSGVWFDIRAGRKIASVFCCDSDTVRKTVIFSGFALPLPEWVKYERITETETARTGFVRDNDDQLKQIVAFYGQNGRIPVLDTVKR